MKIAKLLITPLASVVLLGASPALAETKADNKAAAPADADAALAALGGLFKLEPLNADQQTRLPLATRIIGKLIPEGTLNELMGSMFDSFLKPMQNLGKPDARMIIASRLGISSTELDLNDEQTRELADLFDPARDERHQREMAVFPEMMAQMMRTMEPPMRKAMAELYAIHFTSAELADIDAFFSTESGANYARKSFTMASDPRILAATMKAMPAIKDATGDMERRMKEASAGLAAPRAYGDLNEAERARITQLTGLEPAEIEQALEAETDW